MAAALTLVALVATPLAATTAPAQASTSTASGTTDPGVNSTEPGATDPTPADPAPANPAPAFTADGAPEFVGDVWAGSTVALSTPGFSPTPTALTYSWSLDGTVITGQTASRLTLDATTVGKALAGTVTASAPGYSDFVGSTEESIVQPQPQVQGTVPTISGVAKVGLPLTASTAAFTPSSAVVTYRWWRDDTAIVGATQATYVPVPADAGSVLTVHVAAAAATYKSFTAVSRPTATVGIGVLPAPNQPALSGSARVGSTLTALTSKPAGTTLTWTWLRDGTAIDDAHGATYVLTPADRGTGVQAQAVLSAPGYADSEPSISDKTAIVTEQVPAPKPTISGALLVGHTLEALAGSSQPGTSYSYVWLRSGVPVAGRTASTYVLTASDAGSRISVTVTASRDGYLSSTVRSASTETITGTITTTTAPRISGTLGVGSTLTAQPGSFSPSSATVSYQWLRSGSTISKATGKTYRPTASDAGRKLSVKVTFKRAYYATVTKTSASTAPIQGTFTTHPSVISGTRQVGKTFTATFPAWSPSPTTKSYQWYRGGSAISGAHSAKYTLTGSDAGKKISVKITGKRANYATASRTTVKEGTIAKAAAPRATTAPHLSGTSRNGSTLTVSNGSWNVAGLTPHYTWYRSGTLVSYATSRSYALTGNDVGKTIKARVTMTKGGYANGSSGSNTSGAVAKAAASFSKHGLLKVGRDIPTGTFYNSGGDFCYWARLSSTDTYDGIIANDVGTGQRIMTVEASDAYVEIDEGCGSWYRINTLGPVRSTIPGDGVFKVGQQIKPGTYRASVGSDQYCYTERRASGSGSFDDLIANNGVDGPGTAYVTIESSDYAFESSDCGTWTKVG